MSGMIRPKGVKRIAPARPDKPAAKAQGTVEISEGVHFNSTEVGIILDVDSSTIRKRARRLGIGKFGQDYMFTREDIDTITRDMLNPGKRGPKPKKLAPLE